MFALSCNQRHRRAARRSYFGGLHTFNRAAAAAARCSFVYDAGSLEPATVHRTRGIVARHHLGSYQHRHFNAKNRLGTRWRLKHHCISAACAGAKAMKAKNHRLNEGVGGSAQRTHSWRGPAPPVWRVALFAPHPAHRHRFVAAGDGRRDTFVALLLEPLVAQSRVARGARASINGAACLRIPLFPLSLFSQPHHSCRSSVDGRHQSCGTDKSRRQQGVACLPASASLIMFAAPSA